MFKAQSNILFSTFFNLTLLTLTLNACVSLKDWKEDQYLLVGQAIKGYKSIDYYDLEGLFRQKTNRRMLGMTPYLWIYEIGAKIYKNEQDYDSIIDNYILAENLKKANKWQKRKDKLFTTQKYDELIFENADNNKKVDKYVEKKKYKQEKIELYKTQGNWLMRTAGEPPVFYDSLLIQTTVEEMIKYYQTKGFFSADIRFSTQRKEKRKRIFITYNIQENIPTKIRNIAYLSPDTAITNLITKNVNDTYLNKNENYNEVNLDNERTRLEKIFRNNGYFDFTRQFILFKVDTNLVDTTQREYKIADIQVVIEQPNDSTNHKVYILDKVEFYSLAPQFTDSTKIKDKSFNKVQYSFRGGMIYSPKILDTRIKMKPETPYSFDKTLETQRALLNLDMFKFVNVKFDLDKKSNLFKASIFTSPLDKYQLSVESGLNVGQGLPGPFVSFSFKNRNPFRGCELFEANLQFTIDGQTGFSNQNEFYSSQEIILSTSLTFPQLLFPTKLRFKFNQYNPNTRVSFGINLVERPEYARNNIQAAISYRGRRNFSTYNLTLAELNVVNTRRISESFQEQLDELQAQGNPIGQSFDRAFISSAYVIYTYNNAEQPEKKTSQYLRILAESGGTIGNLLNQTVGKDERIFGLKIFQFLRASVAFHYNYPFGREENQAIVFRLFAGVASPTGKSTVLPYEKFFFSGGANSLRAWQPRRLGPGAYTPPRDANGNFDYRFEQPGEINLEANFEYRFPMISFIEGALFLDAGNVWTLNPETTRPNGNFTNDFWKQIALGTGLGIRFDFSFLILRADFGIKVYNPAEAKNERFVLPKFDWTNPFGKNQTILNIGIGYPF